MSLAESYNNILIIRKSAGSSPAGVDYNLLLVSPLSFLPFRCNLFSAMKARMDVDTCCRYFHVVDFSTLEIFSR